MFVCLFLGRLYGDVLHNLKIRVFEVVDTPLTIIEDHFFLGVNKTLQELYLFDTNFEKYPTESLQVSDNLKTTKQPKQTNNRGCNK